MSFDLFVQSCIVLKRMTDVFKKYDDDRDGYITLSFEEFLTGEFVPLFCDFGFWGRWGRGGVRGGEIANWPYRGSETAMIGLADSLDLIWQMPGNS